MIIDMLSHIGKRKGKVYTVEELMDLMIEAKVDKCMVCSQLETVDNDYIYECTKKYPQNLLGFAVINPWDIDGEEQLEKCFRDYSFYGLKLNGIRFGFSADRHSLLDPFFELCKKYNKIAVVHCMSDLFSLPDKWHEMAKTFPSVPIILYHMGVPMMSDSALKIAKKRDNVFLGTAGTFTPVIKQAIEKVGAEKVIFSSDAPYGSMTQEIDRIKYVTDNEKFIEMILGGNIEKILNLEN